MKIMLTNDDGFSAPGIEALYAGLKSIHPSFEIKICAPVTERSSTGHHFSLHDMLRLEKIEEDIYACSGYPADCSALGINAIYGKDKPDLVISGINRGGNLAQDIYYSGTLAAAREAVLNGVPALGISLCTEFDFGHMDHLYETGVMIVTKLIDEKIHNKIPKDHVLNINVPNLPFSDLKGMRITELGRRKYGGEVEKRYDPRGGEYWWNTSPYNGVETPEGSDCAAIVDRFASLSVLNVFPKSSDKKASLQEIAEAF